MAQKTPYSAHLLVVSHGLWGTRSHVGYICSSALEHSQRHNAPRSRPRANSPPRADGEAEEDVKLVVLPASLNEASKTYDGIDTCAERVVQEIDLEIDKIREEGGTVTRFSIVGYSLGGLVARYVLGLLESRTPSFFANIRPVNFTTFATPHIGIPRYNSFWSVTIRFLGARMLSRTGSQLYENDRFLPSSIVEGNNQQLGKKGTRGIMPQREKAEPLLAVMANPQYSFFKAMTAFERVEIYANSVGDRTVPYPTGAIEAHDPFSLARAKAIKAAHDRGEDPEYEPDILEGGLEIVLEEDGALIKSYTVITPPHISQPRTVRRRFHISLPLLLRPTTYPFSRPISILIIVLLPVALPLALLYLIGRFTLQGNESRRRIKAIRAASGSGREGMLQRVGVRIRDTIDDVAETVQPDNPENLVEHGEGGEPDDEQPEERKTILRHPSFAAFTNYGGTETPPLARPVSPGLDVLSDAEAAVEPAHRKPHPTDPILSDVQIDMIRYLNSIPQLRKHLAYFPKARNAHGMLVARDLSFPQHREGIKVVDAWAREFRL